MPGVTMMFRLLAARTDDHGARKVPRPVNENPPGGSRRDPDAGERGENFRDRTNHLQLRGNRIDDILSARGCDMDELIEFEFKPGAPAVTRENRRPGRREFVDPALIPLLREQGPPVPDFAPEPIDLSEYYIEPGRRASLATSRGILLGMVLGTMTWVCVGFGCWMYWHA